jgi:sugar/nucleoside kinase (ribokinase family)
MRRGIAAAGSYELPLGYIKGSVGAGDAFCAGILYSIYRGFDMPHALKFANGAADIEAFGFPQRTIDFP